MELLATTPTVQPSSQTEQKAADKTPVVEKIQEKAASARARETRPPGAKLDSARAALKKAEQTAEPAAAALKAAEDAKQKAPVALQQARTRKRKAEAQLTNKRNAGGNIKE